MRFANTKIAKPMVPHSVCSFLLTISALISTLNIINTIKDRPLNWNKNTLLPSTVPFRFRYSIWFCYCPLVEMKHEKNTYSITETRIFKQEKARYSYYNLFFFFQLQTELKAGHWSSQTPAAQETFTGIGTQTAYCNVSFSTRN